MPLHTRSNPTHPLFPNIPSVFGSSLSSTRLAPEDSSEILSFGSRLAPGMAFWK